MKFNIFYSWQSDAPAKSNHYLIRDCIESAAKRIRKDVTLEESPRVDHDTRGLSGTPEIAASIFSKIDQCGIFVADVSLVGSVQKGDRDRVELPSSSLGRRVIDWLTRPSVIEPIPSSTKRCPNPNVLVELGYAAARTGWPRIICVMNTRYGEPNELIFDLVHRRWPLQYASGPTDFAECKAGLTDGLEKALRDTMRAELDAVDNAIRRLEVHSLGLISNHGNQAGFSIGDLPKTMGEILGIIPPSLAVGRMLDLGLVDCRTDSVGRYSYNWTYLGSLVAEKLGYRTPLTPAGP